MSSEEIRLAGLEKKIENIEAENYALLSRIRHLEDEIRFSTPRFDKPVEVVGSWKTTSNTERTVL